MWSSRAGLFRCLCLATILLSSCSFGQGDIQTYGKHCDPEELPSKCNERNNERCYQENNQTAKCTCLLLFEWDGKNCIPRPSTEPPTINANTSKPDSDHSVAEGNTMAVIVLIPCMLVLVSVVAYVGARRYKWIQRFRQFRQNRYGSVLVTRDDTDDDDPPIA